MAYRRYYRRPYYRRRFYRRRFYNYSFSNIVKGKFKKFLASFLALLGVFVIIVLFFRSIPSDKKQAMAVALKGFNKNKVAPGSYNV